MAEPSSRCPTCGADLKGYAVCGRCGTLAAAELKLANFGNLARQAIDDWLGRLPQKFRPHHFLWACAIMPIFMLPPLVSLVTAIVSIRRGGDGRVNLEWLAIISAINIVLSGLILYKFYFSPAEVIAYAAYLLHALVQSLNNLLGVRPPIQLTPV